MKTVSASLNQHINQECTTLAMCAKFTLTKYQPLVIDVSRDNPGVVQTLWDPGYATGDPARLVHLVGATELNNREVTLTRIDGTHYSIGIDTSAMSRYSHKGELRKVVAFTDYIHDLTFGGILYKATLGYMPKTIKSGADLSVDNMQIVGLMPNKVAILAAGLLIEGINDEDLSVGRFDHARVELFFLNYENLAQGRIILPGSGNIGQITQKRGTHESEFRGKTIFLQQTIGDLYSKLCRAQLGDDITDYRQFGFGCKVRLDPPFWHGSISHAIVAVNQGAHRFSIATNVIASFFDTSIFRVSGSTGNDGNYTITGLSYNGGAGNTEIITAEAIPDATADGSILYARYYNVRPDFEAGLGSVVKPTAYNQRHYICVTAGVPATSEPTWNPYMDTITNDGGVQWKAIQALTSFGAITSFVDRRFFSDAARNELPLTGVGINTRIVQFAIRDLNQAGQWFEIDGDMTSFFTAATTFAVTGSIGNDGNYTVNTASFTGTATRIVVTAAIPDPSISGSIGAPLALATGFFAYGKITFLTGENRGVSKEIKDFNSTLYNIVGVNTGAQLFMVAGNQTANFFPAQRFVVVGSTGNNQTFDCQTATYNGGTMQTEILTGQAIPDGTVDGQILSGPGQFELMERMPFDVNIGDTYIATAGCDWSKKVCQQKFDNIYNRRSEDEIPGTDISLLSPEKPSGL